MKEHDFKEVKISLYTDKKGKKHKVSHSRCTKDMMISIKDARDAIYEIFSQQLSKGE